MAEFNAEARLKAYKELLNTKDLGVEQLMMINDMLEIDVNLLSNVNNETSQLKEEITRLRDTNHQLFLRVTGDSNTLANNPINSEMDMAQTFEKMIQEGTL